MTRNFCVYVSPPALVLGVAGPVEPPAGDPFEWASEEEGPCEGDDDDESAGGRLVEPLLGDRFMLSGLVTTVVVLRLEAEMNRVSGGGCGWAAVGVVKGEDEGWALEGEEWDV